MPIDSAPSTQRTRKSPPAALLSLFVAGLGQAAHGRLRRGVTFFFIELAAAAVGFAVILYLPIEYWNIAIGFGLAIAVRVASVIDAGNKRAISDGHSQRHPLIAWPVLMLIGMTASGVFALSVRAVWCESFFTPTRSMLPTVRPDERFLVDKMTYKFVTVARGDVVAYRDDAEPDTTFLGRVIALPGERVEVRRDVVYIDDQPLVEPYAHIDLEVPAYPNITDLSAQTMGPGQLFIMGDNRRRAADSRIRGPALMHNIIGRARTIYWSRTPAQQPDDHDQAPTSSGDGRMQWQRIGLRL